MYKRFRQSQIPSKEGGIVDFVTGIYTFRKHFERHFLERREKKYSRNLNRIEISILHGAFFENAVCFCSFSCQFTNEKQNSATTYWIRAQNYKKRVEIAEKRFAKRNPKIVFDRLLTHIAQGVMTEKAVNIRTLNVSATNKVKYTLI